MSDAQTYEEVTVSSDGVIVTKRFEADEFPVPAIAFNVSSKRSEPVTLRLVDTVPDDVAVEDLGFHPEYGSEYWDINEDRIAFEKEIQADSEYTTVYGIRATGTDDVEKFLTEPEIESVDPPLDEDESDIVGSGDDAVKDVIAGEADSVPGLEDDEDDEDIETLDLKDPNNPDAGTSADAESADADGEEGDADTNGEVGEGTVIAAMADEIRQSNVSPDDVKLLQRALDAVSDGDSSGGGDGATNAKIQRLQQDIADLRAYTDALEEFLEENGTGDEMIEEFSQRLDQFETELNSFESDIQSARSTAQSANDGVESLEEEVSTVEEDVDEVESEVNSIGNSLRTVEDDVDEFDTEIEELSEHISDLEGEVESLHEEIGDGEVDERLSELEDEIVELNEWREQLSSVIGGS
jgi:archaellum component FlaC